MTARHPVISEQLQRPGEPAGHVARWPWAIAASVLVVDIALLGGLAAEGSVLARPGGSRYLLAPLAALLVYAAAVSATARWNVRPRLTVAVRVGALAGMLSGAMWIASLTVETFGGLSGWPSIAATAPLLLGAFVLWSAAAAVAARRANSLAAGVLAAVAAAMVCVTATIAFGFALAYLALPTLAQNIDGSPEYLASHWGDLQAFAIANTLDAAFQHLALAPIIATLTGTLGALAATWSRFHPALPSGRRAPRPGDHTE